MNATHVAELREGAAVDAPFAVAWCELRMTRAHEAYLALRLSNATGSIGAVWFRPARTDVERGSVVRVRGTVTAYRGECRVSVDALTLTETFDRRDLVAACRRDTDELVGYFECLRGEVRTQSLRTLLDLVFGDPEFFRRFRECPASRRRHHACLGGLLEHTVAVASFAQHVGQAYPYVDADMLLAGALLHDIGKVDEFTFDSAIEYTDEARLVGHVVLGERRVAEAAVRAHVPEDLALRLRHLLLAHHGELEWGSPRRPATLEAIILHHVDNLDAKMAGFMDAVTRNLRDATRWTDASNLFKRPLYVPRAASEDRPRRPEEDDEYCMETAQSMP